ncbi:hypothetical protein OCAE111667_06690 [Occultella aeris]|uniref:Uncharacterized protein n=2 Tax=Occultella aeris TaxID=2761496 RepID=A0A7M4DRV8_9MICO|nr:hypothetical protein HALOF300_04905 [Occultella aeris]
MSAQPTGSNSQRAGAVRMSLRRAAWASLGIVLVLAASAAVRSLGVSSLPAFVGYALLVWALLPVLVTVVVVCVVSLGSGRPLSMAPTAILAGLALAGWVSWGVGLPIGIAYGLPLGLGAAGAGWAAGSSRRAVARVVAVTVIVVVTVVFSATVTTAA